MYLSTLKIWNFRKYGIKEGETITGENAGLTVSFQSGLNVLIGENDSGKTSIVDAIKHVLLTQSHEYLRFDERDFHKSNGIRAEHLRIECTFEGFNDREAADFLEWIGFDKEGKYILKVWLTAHRKQNRIVSDIRAGLDNEGALMDGAARDLLRITYLKPLRDAESELTPGYNSRLAQILKSDELFYKGKADGEEQHVLEKYVGQANKLIKEFFTEEQVNENEELGILEGTKAAGHIRKKIIDFLSHFFEVDKDISPFIEISGSDLIDILKRLSLNLEENKSGLGSLNLLFIAAELILMQRENERGLKLAIIEELEAHLHPQAQLRLIDFLQTRKSNQQFIITTHSTTVGSKIDLNSLILCQGDDIYPMRVGLTALNESDYGFLERFLDATKANMFFAKGVIIVEGDAENLLIPKLAELLDRPLHRYGVSIVNVGSKALLRYAKVFKRTDGKVQKVKVSVITDLDIQQVPSPDDHLKIIPKGMDDLTAEQEKRISDLEDSFNFEEVVKVFSSPKWTMEHDLAEGGLSTYLNRAIHIAQLYKSREAGSSPFNPITKDDIVKKIENADEFLEEQKALSEEPTYLAFKIYEKLDKKHASKAVSAQFLSMLLTEDPALSDEEPESIQAYKAEVIRIIKTDPQLKYLRDAIYHVTKPIEG